MPIQVTVEERVWDHWDALLCDFEVTGYTDCLLRVQCGETKWIFDRQTGYKLGDANTRIVMNDMPLIEEQINEKERK